MIEKLYRMIQVLPERDDDKPVGEVIAKLPPGHEVRSLMATTIRCDVCGWAGFLCQGYVAIGEGTFHCPSCDMPETLFVIEAAAPVQ
jgi:rubrerythrin